MNYLLRQWAAKPKHGVEPKHFFTPAGTGEYTALAIACAMFGKDEVLSVEDEGTFTQEVPA